MHYVTHISLSDGFGSQFQHIISVLLICYKHGWTFVYNPIKHIDHNYDNNPDFINKIEDLMNIRKFHKLRTEFPPEEIITECDMTAKYVIDRDPDGIATEESLNKIRNMFWENKQRGVFKNNKTNVAVHIRRQNSYDIVRENEQRYHPEIIFLNTIQRIRDEYTEKDLQFHIYSQGNTDDFNNFISDDTILHINEPIDSTFISMVDCDILITCFSSLSYTAGLLNTGIVYYFPFWHSKLNKWITMDI